ncbi:50S ribosomal protein L17 [Picochlorum sp. SENEW3]|nr:50S ribosomal protein L17 [Picochlorum sp. SENEW3]|eukprot:jgi/Picre1/27749/NNA_000713.t1
MKHRVAFRRLGRSSAHRWALIRTQVSQLVEHERIETTVQKAKELRRVADKVITWGKEGTVAARRHAASVLRRDENVNKVFGPLAERYRDRDGGYTRVVRTRKRRDDAAQLAFIEYIDRPGELRTPRQGRTKGNMFASSAAKAAAAAATGR